MARRHHRRGNAADPFIHAYLQPSVDTGAKPEDWNHYYCWGPGFTSAELRTAVTAAMNVFDFQVGPYYDTYSPICVNAVDVVFEQEFIAGDPAGYYRCDLYSSTGICEKATIMLDTEALATPWTASTRQVIACHEIGHSVGLTHRPGWAGGSAADGCMTDAFLGVVTYNAHHVNHMVGSFDSPIGHLDGAGDFWGLGTAVAGWALDPDVRISPYPTIYVQIDTYVWRTLGPPNVATRADLTAEFPYWTGNWRGFFYITPIGPGYHSVCAWAGNAVGAGTTTPLGCTTVFIP